MSHRLPTPFLVLAVAAAWAPTAAAQITPGNLIVLRAGDGSAALSASSTAAFLEELTTAGTPVQTLALPTAASGPNLPVTIAGSATSEGFVTQTVDGNYLLVTGYGVAPGTASVAGTTSAAVNRVIARIDLGGAIDSTTALVDAHNAGNIRSAVSVDGNSFWTSGAGSTLAGTNRGMAYVASLGATTSIQVPATLTNGRVAGIFDGQLYLSTAAGGTFGVCTIGSGLPTTSGETSTLLNGFGFVTGSGSISQYDFWFADAATVYVSDDRTAANGGGIQKWTDVGGTWTWQYTLTPGSGCRGLSGIVDENGTRLFATTALASANALVSVVDTGPASGFTTLATAPANTVFRGVQFVRTPYSVTTGGTTCPTSVGVPTIGTTGGAPVSGNANFALTVGNAPDITGPFPGVTFWATAIGVPQAFLIPGGFPIPDAPPCALLFALPDILLTGLTDPTGGAVIPLSLAPADSSLWGLPIAVQHAVFDFTGFYAGFGLPVGTTVGMLITIGN
ncbi:MAG: hypothetical protein KF830_12110 [Planctomycetes bacterium]|nr:hypothetical protein [Planctomycetota bacterium]